MPALADKPEAAEDFATVIKNLAQPPVPPRENTPPAKPAPVAKPPEEKAKPAAEITPPAKAAEPKPADEAPKPNEEDHVFGTAPAKPKAEPAKPTDDDFEAKLKAETKDMTEKGQSAWIALRRSEKEAKEELRKEREGKAEREAALKNQPESDGKAETLAQRVKELETELADADAELSLTKVERSQKFRREVAEPMGELSKSAEELATRYDVPVKTVLAALETTDAKERSETLAELAADFNEPDRLDLYQMGREMTRLRKEGDKLREKAKSDLSAVEQEEREEQDRNTSAEAEVRSGAAQTAWEAAAREHESLRDNSAAPGWTAELEAARRASREHVVGKDPASDGALIAKGMMLSFAQREAAHFRSKLKEAQAENEKLLGRIERDNALDPDLGGNGSDAIDEGDSDLDGGDLGAGAKRRFGK